MTSSSNILYDLFIALMVISFTISSKLEIDRLNKLPDKIDSLDRTQQTHVDETSAVILCN